MLRRSLFALFPVPVLVTFNCSRAQSMAELELLEASFPSDECVLDETRRAFVREQASVVSCLMKGELNKRNRFRRLLLGCKAVGKTTLLKSLLKAANTAYPELMTLYVSYADTKVRLGRIICHHLRKSGIKPNISEFLEEACVDEPTYNIILQQQLDLYDLLLHDEGYFRGCGIVPGMAGRIVSAASQPPLFTRLSALLQSADKKLFLVVDELNDVYMGAFPEGRLIIDDILALGEDANGRINCIISGSSTRLRQLAFAKLPNEFKSNYPNYAGVDLNSTKYQPRWIFPFLDVDSFLCLYRTINNMPDNYVPSEEETDALSELFIKTGGSPGGLSECLQNRESSTYHASAKSVKFDPEPDEIAQVLQAVYEALPQFTDSLNHLTFATATTHLIPTHLAKSLADHPESILYDMADAGLIRYITDDPTLKRIGFGSPLVYFTVVMQGKLIVTAFEAAALYMPSGHKMGAVAENVTCRFLAKAFEKIAKVTNPVKFSEKSPLNLNKEGDEHSASFDHYVMYKELMHGQDAFGADAVVLIPDDHESSIAYRVQVKLGTSTIFTEAEKGIKQDSAEDIATKLNSREKLALEAYQRSGIPLSNSFRYLATTRNITFAAQEYFKRKNISVLNKDFLFEHVWPKEIKCLKALP